jgi:hypothetical protein
LTRWRAEHIDVVEFGQLIGRECLAWAVHHVSCVMHKDVDATMFGKDQVHRLRCRIVGLYVELDRSKLDSFLLRVRGDVLRLIRVLFARAAHRGVSDVARSRELVRDRSPESAGGSRH